MRLVQGQLVVRKSLSADEEDVILEAFDTAPAAVRRRIMLRVSLDRFNLKTAAKEALRTGDLDLLKLAVDMA